MFLIAQSLAQGHFVFGETTEIPGALAKLLLVFAVPTDNGVFSVNTLKAAGGFGQIGNCLKGSKHSIYNIFMAF